MKTPVVALALAVLTTTGCRDISRPFDPTPKHAFANSNRPGMTVTVRAKTDGSDFRARSLRIEADSPAVAADIDFARRRRMIEAGLAARGFALAKEGETPGLVVRLDYGADAPRTRVASHDEPTYAVTPARTVVRTEYDDSSRTSKRVVVEEPEVRTQTGSVVVTTTNTEYPYRASLRAYATADAPGAPVWIAEAGCVSGDDAPDRILPRLIAALAMNAGTHRDTPFDFLVRDSALAGLRDRGVLPPPVVNAKAKNDGMFGCFADCAPTLRCDEPDARAAIEKIAGRQFAEMGVRIAPDSRTAVILDYDAVTTILRLDIVKVATGAVLYSVSRKDFALAGTDTESLATWVFTEARRNSDAEKFVP